MSMMEVKQVMHKYSFMVSFHSDVLQNFLLKIVAQNTQKISSMKVEIIIVAMH